MTGNPVQLNWVGISQEQTTLSFSPYLCFVVVAVWVRGLPCYYARICAFPTTPHQINIPGASPGECLHNSVVSIYTCSNKMRLLQVNMKRTTPDNNHSRLSAKTHSIGNIVEKIIWMDHCKLVIRPGFYERACPARLVDPATHNLHKNLCLWLFILVFVIQNIHG